MQEYVSFPFFISFTLVYLQVVIWTAKAASTNTTISFQQSYSVIWGSPRILEDESEVELILGKHSEGSGFMSLDDYCYGVFSASIKLPKDNTAGIVVAFYMSNADAFPKNHDELDFEFLGNVHGRQWTLQTNIYGNGSVERGREERFDFWFDPTEDFHNYSILWSQKKIVFMVDNIAIREMIRREELEGDYPSKPMALYATIWDGSGWATEGGRYAVNYKYAPFVAAFKDMKMEGCSTDAMESMKQECSAVIDEDRKRKTWDVEEFDEDGGLMKWVRNNQMYYSYCDDKSRYHQPLPECLPSMNEKKKSLSYASKHHKHRRSRLEGRRWR